MNLDEGPGSWALPRQSRLAIDQDGTLRPQPAQQPTGHAHAIPQQGVKRKKSLLLSDHKLDQPHGLIVRATLIWMRQVLVTGAAGCVGHYVIEHLLELGDVRPVVLLRDPGRLREDLRARVTCIKGDLADPEPWLGHVVEVEAAILVATSWGGPLAHRVNVETTHRLVEGLRRARRLVYFSTASVLDPDGSLDAAAPDFGTDYIRSKHAALATMPPDPRIVPVFPTVVLGGDDRHPRSAAMEGLPALRPWRGLLARLTFEGAFHVIHAADLARLAVWLIDHPPPSGRLVVGLPALTVREVASAVARALGADDAPEWDITKGLELLPRVLPWKFTAWDRHCLARRNFRYPVVDLRSLTGRLDYPTVDEILASDPRLAPQRWASALK